MRMINISLAFLFIISACSPITPVPTPSSTNTHTPTIAPTLASTVTPKPTLTPTPVLIWVTLGSPFAADCGDGVPIVRANSTFNGLDRGECIDSYHGHTDFWAPNGCDIDKYEGEFIAPIQGVLEPNPGGYTLRVPEGIYPENIEQALRFAGIQNPDIKKINSIRLELGHLEPYRMGYFEKGEPLGEVIPVNPSGHRIQYMLAYWVGVVYQEQGFALSPTLFLNNPSEWPCVNGITLPNECDPIANNYPEKCR